MQVTLKDIAQKMGVTITTVHKALNGQDGVSEKKRAEIIRTAAEMGYRINYMAASLARKEFKIAVVLPDTLGDNQFYYGVLWDGIRNFMQTIREFPFSVSEFTYPLTPDGNGIILERLYQQECGHLDGLITIAANNSRSSYFIEKFAQNNVPVILIGADLYSQFRLCCIMANDQMAGSLAAELLTSFLPAPQPLTVLVGGDFGKLGMTDQYYNILAFQEYLRTNAPYYKIVPFSNADPAKIAADIAQYLKSHSDVFAIYSCSARFTVHITDMIRHLGLQGKIRIIGNDILPENSQALMDGILHAVIDKKISGQSFLAVKTMFNYLVKKEYPHSSILTVDPCIVLRSNVFYQKQ